jgi:hypothetical protein
MPAIPSAAHQPLTHSEITADALKAMTAFLSEGDEAALKMPTDLFNGSSETIGFGREDAKL